MRVVVTAETALKFEMGLSCVALTALRDLTVYGMTGCTIKRAMLALIVPELGIFLNVAGETNTFVRQRHVQRSMRVLVTSEAVVRFKVDFPPCTCMALAAALDRLLDLRRVADMATGTWNRPVPASCSFYVVCDIFMTLYTVF